MTQKLDEGLPPRSARKPADRGQNRWYLACAGEARPSTLLADAGVTCPVNALWQSGPEVPEMTIQLAHLRDQGINFVVFAADAPSKTRSDRQRLLGQLIAAARRAGLAVDKAALTITEGGRPGFFGTPDLVRYLTSLGGVPTWTHSIDV